MENTDFTINLISSNLDDGNKLLELLGAKNEIKNKSLIFHYWKWDYDLNKSFDKQVEKIFEKLEKYKNDDAISNIPNECLVVICNKLEAHQILQKLEKDIGDKDYIPLTLFLYKEEYTINFNHYDKIDSRMIYFRKLSYIYDYKEKFSPIYKILLRFYSIYNELGDTIQIETDGNVLYYNLVDNIVPFNLNILCIGRIRQGKSTCVNCILDQLRTRESNSGVSQTQKINCYIAEEYPIKIYDMPGFEDEETITKTIEKMKELNKEMKILLNRIHIILYIINVNEKAKFIKKEFSIFKEINEHKEANVIFVFTHCEKSLINGYKEKNEKMKELNKYKNITIKNGLNDIKEKENLDDVKINEIKSKMEINWNNTVFLNFHKEKNKPKLGINELFKKIKLNFIKTNSFIKRNEDFYQKSEELKARSLDELNSNIIKGSLLGIIPFLDIFIQNKYLKPDSIEKVSKIFQLKSDEISNDESELKAKIAVNAVKGIGDSTGVGGIILGTQVTSNLFKAVNSSLKLGIGISGFFVSALIGGGMGYYFTKKECDEIVENLYNKYLEICPNMGKNYEMSARYLILMENKYNQNV